MAEFLPRLRQGVPIGFTGDQKPVDPSSDIILLWQTLVELLEQVPDIQALADQAQASADAAQASADAAAASNAQTDAESSIVNSFTKDPEAEPLISIDDVGAATIETHTRQYGNPTLNPDVEVEGDAFATGAISGDVVRFYYDDPTRAGGVVTYQFTIDPAVPPVHGGDRHVVGSVVVPATGSNGGAPVQPPGYTTPLQ